MSFDGDDFILMVMTESYLLRNSKLPVTKNEQNGNNGTTSRQDKRFIFQWLTQSVPLIFLKKVSNSW